MLFHGSNGYANVPLCYTTCTLPVLFNDSKTSQTFEVSAVEELFATHKTFMLLSTKMYTLNVTTQLTACGEFLLTFCATVRSLT